MGFSRTVKRGTPLRPASTAGRAALAVLCLAINAGAVFAQAPEPITEILNRVDGRYQDANGNTGGGSAEVVVSLNRFAGPEIEGSDSVRVCGGDSAVFAHRIRNAGNITDRLSLEAAAPAGFIAAFHHDLDDDGAHQPGDSMLTDGVLLAPGESASVLMVVHVDSTLHSLEAEIVVGVRSEYDATRVASARDVIGLCGPASLSLDLAVDRTDAVPGDTLTYTVSVRNTGESASWAFAVTDTLPVGLVLAPAQSLDFDGVTGIRGSASDRDVVTFRYEALAAGETRSASIAAVVAMVDTALASVTNSVWLEHGSDTVHAQPVTTELRYPRVAVGKRLLNGSTFREGEVAEFELTWANVSDAALRAAVLTDTLPEGLVYVSADPAPHRVEGRVVEWSLGTLEGGAEGAIRVVTRVEDLDIMGVSSLINRVTLNGGAGTAFASAAASAAAALDVRRFAGEELVVRKRAGALEASVGDAVVYAVELENIGDVPLIDVVLTDLMPGSLRLVPGEIAGVDSVRRGRDGIHFHLSGSIPAGEIRTIRYRAVVMGGASGPIDNRAFATAEAGAVLSDTSLARLRVQAGPSAPARTLVGRVWLDVNDNRIQDPGEPGVAGVDVWTAGGLVVRTDPQGRFSLQDLQPGVHVLRIDTLGIGTRYIVPEGERVRDVRMNGWTAGRASLRLLPAPQRAPSNDDHVGPPLRRPDRSIGAGTRAMTETTTEPDTGQSSRVTIAPLRSTASRNAEQTRALIDGPGVAFIGLADGAVVAASRVYLGARGEPGAALRLFDGDSLIAEATIRPDGIHDFVALPLEQGTHRLRLAMRNSWGNERWDSISVHRSGDAALLDVVREPIVLRAESQERGSVAARVLDRWGIPVTHGPYVTVAGRGVTIEAADADAGSVGQQARADAEGWVRVPVRAGGEVGPASVRFAIPGDSAVAPIEVMAPVRPLIVTGTGRIGVGATEGARAAITARGAIDDQTSITVSYDSRAADEDAFLREVDALDESFHPLVGDGSERRVLSGSTRSLSARLERGRDWLALGDVRTEGFTDPTELASYDRSIDGVAGRFATGSVVWHGFGSAAAETLVREQLRGDGTSGPFRLGAGIRPGTDRLALEVRARDNAARVIARTQLDRNLDYQIDYASGEVLLERPIPSVDPNGNPIFLVADVERRGGDRNLLVGLRADVDLARATDLEHIDSLAVGVSAVRDGSDSPGFSAIDLTAANVALRSGDVDARLEMLHGASADSSALAARAGAGWDVRDDARLEVEWLSVGSGFAAGANPRLRAGLDELRVGARMRVAPTTVLSVDHERQSFGELGIERSGTYARVAQELGERDLSFETGLLGNGANGAFGSSLSSRATLRTADNDEIWIEANRSLTSDSSALAPSHVGLGASQRVLPGLRLVGSHRQVWLDDAGYALSELTLRFEPLDEGEVWGGLSRTAGPETGHAASFGMTQRLRFDGGWLVSGMFERRMDLDAAPFADPVRAMPFPRQEADHWSAALGAQWQRASHRLGGHGEVHEGDLNSGYRFEMTGEMNLAEDAAILTRHDWLLERRLAARGTLTDRRDRSLLALAFRPVESDVLNALARIEWRRSDAPDAPGVLGGASFRRLIGTLDLVWAPRAELEAAFRYAVRGNAFAQQSLDPDVTGATAHHLAATVDRAAIANLRGRLDTRLLYSPTADAARWSVAPSLVYELISAVEVEAGYRLGDLDDIDFARSGDSGAFLSLQASFTEEDAGGIAAFWRNRLAR